jgi:uncharacterized protein YceH (UPF0502 family)
MSTIYSTSPAEQIKELNRTIAELRQRVAALEAELGSAKRWEPVHMLAQEYPNRKYGIVYLERDDGKRQLRYFIDRGGEECDETIINLPEDHAICRLVAGQGGC